MNENINSDGIIPIRHFKQFFLRDHDTILPISEENLEDACQNIENFGERNDVCFQPLTMIYHLDFIPSIIFNFFLGATNSYIFASSKLVTYSYVLWTYLEKWAHSRLYYRQLYHVGLRCHNSK